MPMVPVQSGKQVLGLPALPAVHRMTPAASKAYSLSDAT